jgi:DNA-binding beta-propeller fold protein YncE
MLSRNIDNKKIITLASIMCLFIIGITSIAVAAGYNGECWVVNGSGNGEIVKVMPKGEIDPNYISGFEQPQYAVVNPKDGTLWVSDAAAASVFKFSFGGNEPVQIKFTGGQRPRSISIDPTDGSAWVGADTTVGEEGDVQKGSVVKISPDGKKQQVAADIGGEVYVSVNTTDGSCWVADSSGKVLKFSKEGQKLLDASLTKALKEPKYAAVNSATGEVWVADSQAGILVKLDASGKELLRTTDIGMPVSPSVNYKTGDVWVADAKNFQVVKVSANGKVSKAVPGFTFPASVSVNSKTGEVWVADQFANSVTKLSGNGQPVFSVPGFTLPISVSVGNWEEKK